MLPTRKAPDWRLGEHVLCKSLELTRITRVCKLELYNGMGQRSQGAGPESPCGCSAGNYRHSVCLSGRRKQWLCPCRNWQVLRGMWFEMERQGITTVILMPFISRVGNTRGILCVFLVFLEVTRWSSHVCISCPYPR